MLFFFFLHCNRQYILLYGSTNSLSPTRVRATSPFAIAFMMHDKAYNSPSPWQHSVSNQSCPKVMTVTTEIITRLFSPPVLLLPFQSCPTILSFFQCVWCWFQVQLAGLRVGSSVHPWTFYQHTTHGYVSTHTYAVPLILSPVLFSIWVDSGGLQGLMLLTGSELWLLPR